MAGHSAGVQEEVLEEVRGEVRQEEDRRGEEEHQGGGAHPEREGGAEGEDEQERGLGNHEVLDLTINGWLIKSMHLFYILHLFFLWIWLTKQCI